MGMDGIVCSRALVWFLLASHPIRPLESCLSLHLQAKALTKVSLSLSHLLIFTCSIYYSILSILLIFKTLWRAVITQKQRILNFHNLYFNSEPSSIGHDPTHARPNSRRPNLDMTSCGLTHVSQLVYFLIFFKNSKSSQLVACTRFFRIALFKQENI